VPAGNALACRIRRTCLTSPAGCDAGHRRIALRGMARVPRSIGTHHDGREDRCSLGSVHSYAAFGPGGVALDQGPTRCCPRTPSGHARAPLLTTTTRSATLATAAACSPCRRVRRGALADPRPPGSTITRSASQSLDEGQRRSTCRHGCGARAAGRRAACQRPLRHVRAGEVAVRTSSSPSRPALRAAAGRPQGRQQPDRHRGTAPPSSHRRSDPDRILHFELRR
jgi:hypothetical protein